MRKVPVTSALNSSEAPIVKDIEPLKETKVTIDLPKIILFLAIIGFGIFTGYVLAGGGSPGSKIGNNQSAVGSGGDVKKMVGKKDDKIFPDTAEGILREGGVNNEGTHHLE